MKAGCQPFSQASVFLVEAQSAIANGWRIVELLQIRPDGFRRRLKKAAQFRLDVKFPFRAHFALGSRRRGTEQTLLRRFRPLGVRALRDLAQKFSQKWIELGNLEAISLAADFHISWFVPA